MATAFQTDFIFPALFAIDTEVFGNPIQQIFKTGYRKIVAVEENDHQSFVLTWADDDSPKLAVTDENIIPDGFDKVLLIDSATPFPNYGQKWIRHPLLGENLLPEEINFQQQCKNVLQSWKDGFYFRAKIEEGEKGLRLPQLGAVHAALAHRTVSEQAATIVMPTGTGKTDTMISIFVAAQCERVLIVVPTDALRTQISKKFLSLGVLPQENLITDNARFPIVGILKHKLTELDEVDEFFQKCDVVVTTMAIAGQCTIEIQERIATWCTDLFIDEAHHIGARTWYAFKRSFEEKHTIQFTATPFRNDGRAVGGKIIYNYSLGKAQIDGFFKPIKFDPVTEYNPKKADLSIAQKAVEQLKKDRATYNHVLMARVESIKRAKEIFLLYEQFVEFNPVQIHSGLTDKQKEEARKAILSGDTKIIVCVDMFGEGFDLPELKIAAFHDVKKSLPITLQLAGRFVRTRHDLGEPTFIANIADVSVQDELKKLYSQDADWNLLLQQSSESVIQNQVDLWEFLRDFTNFPEDIPLQNIRPALSTVIYKTKCMEWTPNSFIEALEKTGIYEQIYSDINMTQKVLVVVTGKKIPIGWAQVKNIYDLEWELLILHWDQNQNLLYINGSSNEGYYKDLAQSVAGEVELIKDNNVFRSLYGVNRLKLQNVGLINQFGKLIKYTMRAGSDIESGLSDAQKGIVRKANVFGTGYENGRRTSIGCSYKGRIWSRRIGNLEELIEWCNLIGKKVLDESIDPNEVLKGTLVSETISKRPNKMPIWIDWPDIIYTASEISYTFLPEDGYRFQLFEADIRLIDPTENDDIRFEIFSDDISFSIKLLFSENDFQYIVESEKKLTIRHGYKEQEIESFFYENSPTIYFIDGSTLDGNSYTLMKKKPDPYSIEKINDWDWTGINIRKESQGTGKEPDSVQYRVIETLKAHGYSLIFDDDDSGEIADVFAIKDFEHKIEIELYHCKFSKEDNPGARIDDLYAVCGQAQKSVRWMERALDQPEEIFSHLLRRESKRYDANQASRVEVGSTDLLETLKVKSRSCPIEMRIFIVQPGLSKSKISADQLELLGATENYLMETGQLPFTVICSS